ncbi:MAG TPA: hypothetical protein PLM22_04310 [Candidatus Sabulitectum sp.]|nr:hypothetical protein [Candidatus Sabulitectum sp.]HPJ28133.1 hypothetical protein [Candidatus Sabulitectum sp.]
MHEDHTEPHGRKLSPFGRLFRFIGWWLGLTSLYSAFSVCPFCGQPGCPAGLASAGAVGAFLTLCIQDWRSLFRWVRDRLQHKKNRLSA